MNQTVPNVKIIPAVVKPIEKTNKYKQLRVAAYCRVSTEQEEQQNSYNVQIAYYTGPYKPEERMDSGRNFC